MQFTEEEIKIIKTLIIDYGFEYGLDTKLEDVVKLAQKLGMDDFINQYKEFT